MARRPVLSVTPGEGLARAVSTVTTTRESEMADTGTLRDAFVDNPGTRADAERQLTKALAKMAKAATAPKLQEAFQSSLEETQGQIQRLEQVFEALEEESAR